MNIRAINILLLTSLVVILFYLLFKMSHRLNLPRDRNSEDLSTSELFNNSTPEEKHSKHFDVDLRNESLRLGGQIQRFAALNNLPDWYMYHAILIGDCDATQSSNGRPFSDCLSIIGKRKGEPGTRSVEPHAGQYACYLFLSRVEEKKLSTCTSGQITLRDLYNSVCDSTIIDGDVSWLVTAMCSSNLHNPTKVKNKYNQTIEFEDLFTHLVANESRYCFGLHRKLAVSMALEQNFVNRDLTISKLAISELSQALTDPIPRLSAVPNLIRSREPKLMHASDNDLVTASLNYLGHELHWRAAIRNKKATQGFGPAAEDCISEIDRFVDELYSTSYQIGTKRYAQKEMYGAACHALSAILYYSQ